MGAQIIGMTYVYLGRATGASYLACSSSSRNGFITENSEVEVEKGGGGG